MPSLSDMISGWSPNMDLYGLSYHKGNRKLNEQNWGAGLTMTKPSSLGELVAEMGGYKNSFKDPNYYVGGGLRWMGPRIGFQVTGQLRRSDSYAGGKPHVVPMPNVLIPITDNSMLKVMLPMNPKTGAAYGLGYQLKMK